MTQCKRNSIIIIDQKNHSPNILGFALILEFVPQIGRDRDWQYLLLYFIFTMVYKVLMLV